MTRILSREEFAKKLKEGRMFVYAGLYERQDYKVQLTKTSFTVVRDVTNEPNQHHRKIIGGMRK